MHLKTTLILYVILIFVIDVELTLLKDNFQYFVHSVANVFHSNWRKNYLSLNPNVRNRFKLTNNGSNYNSSDFIYPMILTVGSCLVHRNLKVARHRYNSSNIYVDILNMEYNELPSDWAYENRATALIACKYVYQGIRQKHLFNQQFLEEISEKIHIQWMKRNANRASNELMIPYANLSEVEKDKDRKSVLIALRLFNELYLYKRFNTTPIYFNGPINQI